MRKLRGISLEGTLVCEKESLENRPISGDKLVLKGATANE